ERAVRVALLRQQARFVAERRQRIVQLGRVDAVHADRDLTVLADRGLGARLAFDSRVIERVRRLEMRNAIVTEPKRVAVHGDDDFRGVCVGLAVRPELRHIEGAAELEESHGGLGSLLSESMRSCSLQEPLYIEVSVDLSSR